MKKGKDENNNEVTDQVVVQTETTNPKEEVPMEETLVVNAVPVDVDPEQVKKDMEVIASVAGVDIEDVELYEQYIQNGNRTGRSGDPESAFTKMKELILRLIKVAEAKGTKQFPSANVVRAALKQGWFDKVSKDEQYNRAYNYFHQNSKRCLPVGWVVEKIGKTSYLIDKRK